jgi:putative hydrolase of the HAD superfamily
MEIKTFLFDLGNVLLYFSHERMCDQMGKLCGKSGQEIRELLIDTGQHLVYERGEMSEDGFHRWFQEVTRSRIPLAALRRAAADIFEENVSMFPVLDRLKQRGHRLVLLSNTNASHIHFIRRQYDVLERFDDLILSYETGAVKPESPIFEEALRRIDCAPYECFYTDDIPAYVERGRTFGLQADVYTGTSSFLSQIKQWGITLNE